MIFVMQMKCCVHKGYQIFAVRVDELDEGESQDDVFARHPILQEFSDVFLSEILGMLPKHDIDLRIDLIPVAKPISKDPYRMTTQELGELRFHLEELLAKGFI